MPKTKLGINVLQASEERIKWSFDNFEKLYISLSGGKDSTTMLHLILNEAIKRDRKIGLFIVDLEAQYKLTIENLNNLITEYKDYLDVYWICLPISLRNAVSVYEPKWICWDEDREYDRDWETYPINI
jgi:predicted phosphoadenosine phosphosulfate sulfurtransferase